MDPVQRWIALQSAIIWRPCDLNRGWLTSIESILIWGAGIIGYLNPGSALRVILEDIEI